MSQHAIYSEVIAVMIWNGIHSFLCDGIESDLRLLFDFIEKYKNILTLSLTYKTDIRVISLTAWNGSIHIPSQTLI